MTRAKAHSISSPPGASPAQPGFRKGASAAMALVELLAVVVIKLVNSGLAKIFAIRDGDYSAAMPNHATYRNAIFFDWHAGRLDFNNNPL